MLENASISILSTDEFVNYAQDLFNQKNYPELMKELEVLQLKKNNTEYDKVLINP